MSPSRPTVVGVSSEAPWPLNTGGHIRTFHLLKALARAFDVRLLAAGASDDRAAVAALAGAGVAAEIVRVPARTRLSEAWRVVTCEATRQPYVLYARHRHQAVEDRLRAVGAERPDVLYLDHLDSCTYRGSVPARLRVVDLHNVYSLIAERSGTDRGALAAFYLRHQARLLRKTEREAATRSDLLFAVSEQELSYYRGLGARRVALIPNGVDAPAYASLPTGRSGPPLVVYIGAMSWQPNADAAIFLAEHVLPALQQRCPGARLRIIGRGPGADVRALDGRPGVEVAGEVASMLPHLEEASVLAVPLEAGGGTRLKILEAMAAGLPVVSTAVGAEGLVVTPGEHLRLATRQDFATALADVLLDPSGAAAMAGRARALVQQRYDWAGIGAEAAAAIRDVLREQP